jgi:hypothetical protein
MGQEVGVTRAVLLEVNLEGSAKAGVLPDELEGVMPNMGHCPVWW